MPQEISKTATVVTGSVDDMIKVLRDASSKKRISGDIKDIAEKALYKNHGSGSLFLDILRRPLKKTRAGKAINNGISKVQRKIVDTDMKAGKIVYDALTKNPKNKRGQWLGNKFVQKHQFHLGENTKGTPDEILEVGAAGLTNPIAKGRDAVLPVAGAFAIGDQISKARKKSEGGDTVKSAYTREEIIDKMTAFIDGNKGEKIASIKTTKTNTDKEIMKKASEILKVAAEKIRNLENDNEKLALENQRLYLEKVTNQRKDEAIKLASQMNDKGIIKKADLEDKIEELISMDETAFSMFKNAIENISSYNAEKDGVDSLTFVMDNNNINYRKTFADSINEAVNEIK